MGQGEHVDAPAVARYVSTAQFAQTASAEALQALLGKRPVLQTVQPAQPTAPDALAKLTPAAHGVHALAPPAEKDPALQGLQAARPVEAAQVPAAHGSGELLPNGQ